MGHQLHDRSQAKVESEAGISVNRHSPTALKQMEAHAILAESSVLLGLFATVLWPESDIEAAWIVGQPRTASTPSSGCKSASQKLRLGKKPERRDIILTALAALTAAATPVAPAFAKRGELAEISTSGSATSSGDPTAECMFFRPGTTFCEVYKDATSKAIAKADTAGALKSIKGIAESLKGLEESIAAANWFQVSQLLGAVRELKPAIQEFQSSTVRKQGKAVLSALQGIGGAVQSKDTKKANKFLGEYLVAMPELLRVAAESL